MSRTETRYLNIYYLPSDNDVLEINKIGNRKLPIRILFLVNQNFQKNYLQQNS